MTINEEVASLFLEAHYYDNGVRHLVFPASPGRPSWAPPPDRAGIKNADLRMQPGVAVIEYCRVATEGSQADWLGVFWPSGDQQLGNRGNYAGIGLWSHSYRYANCNDLVDGLGKISSQVAQCRGVPDKLASNILSFMNKFLPAYLVKDAVLPEGIRPIPAAGRIARTKVEALKFPLRDLAQLPAEVCKSVADRLMIANLTHDPEDDYSRLLIVVAEDHAAIRDGDISPLHEVPNLTYHVLKFVGATGIETRRRADGLARDNERMAQEIRALEVSVSEGKKNEECLQAELSDLKEVNRNLEAGRALSPDLVRRLDRIEGHLISVSSLTDFVQRRFNTFEDRLDRIYQQRPGQGYKNAEAHSSAVHHVAQSEPTLWDTWGNVILIGAIVIVLTGGGYILYSLFF